MIARLFAHPNNHENKPGAPVQKLESFAGLPCGDQASGTFKVTSPYGWRTLEIHGQKRRQFHNGIDLRSWNLPKGNKPGFIYAVESGVVAEVLQPDREFPAVLNADGTRIPVPEGRGWTPYLLLRADSGRVWVYRHVRPIIGLGVRVVAASVIAETDRNYGFSNGIHLHLECWVDGKNVDPLPILEGFGFKEVQGW